MKACKYEIGEHEMVSLIPCESIIKAYILFKEGNYAVLYLPPITEYKHGNKWKKDTHGCGCIIFARKDGIVWVKSHNDFVNLNKKQNKFIKENFE